MDEPNIEENELIEDILASLNQDETIQSERVNLKNSCPGKANQLSDVTQHKMSSRPTVPLSIDPVEMLINTAEVIFEDGLSINDVLTEEIIVSVNEIECNEPGTSYQVNPIEKSVESTMNFNDTNKYIEATNKNIIDSNTFDDFDNPDNPDFVLSDNDLINDNTENNTTNVTNETYNPLVNNSLENNVNSPLANDSLVNNNLNEVANSSEENLCAVEATSDNSNTIKRKRNKRSNESLWDVNVHKKLRMTGKKYVGYEKIKIDGKVTVKRSEHEHEERKIGPVCSSKICKANKKRKCTEITEVDRKNIFKYFWPLSWKEKQVYIRDHVQKYETYQKTLKDESKPSRRSGTYKYYLRPNNGESKPVCKVMFLNTLGLKEWMVQNWITNKDDVSEGEEDEKNDDQQENGIFQTETGSKKEKKLSQKKIVISEWLDTLPIVPSHYCRASSSKMYLEPIWDSKVELYRKYKEFCTINNRPWGSLTTFMEVFEEKNLSIFTPKKDQCDTCYAFKAGNVSKEVYDKHINEKDSARGEKENDKQKALTGEIYCLTADVESVKLTPMTKASSMYYKTKLCSHNYTVYNLANRHCTCFWFTEVEGDLSANTFASCLLHYLKEHCSTPRLPIVVYTDGCTNQNRNQFLANALLHFAVQNEVEIIQKYLVKGHTQMEGDSVHARIENKIKGKDVYMPYEYVKYTKEAREKPFPYDAVYLKHEFFRDFSNINYYDSVRPGKKKGDPCIVDVRCFKFNYNGTIQYKLSFNENFVDLPRRPKKVGKDLEPLQLFKERIPIPYSKWKHLQDLKLVIPEDYHHFYDSLPYQK